MSPSTRLPHVFVCVTCEIPIAGHPVFHVGLPFCCAGCVANGPCSCSYDEAPVVRSERAATAVALAPEVAPQAAVLARVAAVSPAAPRPALVADQDVARAEPGRLLVPALR